MEFFVFNSRTCVSFTPIGYIPAKTQVQAIAGSTGAFGRVYERFLAVTAASFLTGGIPLEFEGGAAALAGARGVLVRGWQLGATQFTELGTAIGREFTWGTFAAKALGDGAVQFGSGLLTKGSALKSVSDMNFFSMLVAGIMPGEGCGPALRNSVLTSTVKMGVSKEAGNAHPYLELPELTSLSGVGAYLLNIGTGTIADVAKAKIFEAATPYFRLTSSTLNQAEFSALKWMSAHREVVGTLTGAIPGAALLDAYKEKGKEALQDYFKDDDKKETKPKKK